MFVSLPAVVVAGIAAARVYAVKLAVEDAAACRLRAPAVAATATGRGRRRAQARGNDATKDEAGDAHQGARSDTAEKVGKGDFH
jgi:hypothetical protein